MRISDWSSDVCSSDLVQKLLQACGGQPAVLQRDVEHRPALLVGALGDGRGFFVADDRVERGDQDRVAVERGSHVVAAHLHPGDGGVGEQARDVGQHAYRVEQVRSEEHTSELQSLMRISYAVFCLKKKTTK